MWSFAKLGGGGGGVPKAFSRKDPFFLRKLGLFKTSTISISFNSSWGCLTILSQAGIGNVLSYCFQSTDHATTEAFDFNSRINGLEPKIFFNISVTQIDGHICSVRAPLCINCGMFAGKNDNNAMWENPT